MKNKMNKVKFTSEYQHQNGPSKQKKESMK